MTQDALKQYKEQQIMLASPVKLVSMLYDEAIRQLNTVVQCIEAGEVEARWQANTKVTDIIHHMLVTLDKERGGEIAENLEKLFIYILQRLPEVDLKNSKKAAEDVINLLTPVAESWRALAVRNEGEIQQAVEETAQQTKKDAPVIGAAHKPVEEDGKKSEQPSERIAISA